MGGHVARMREMRNVYKVLVANLKRRGHSEDQGEDGRIVVECILNKLEWCEMDSSCPSRQN
jgi:hypothetical protein